MDEILASIRRIIADDTVPVSDGAAADHDAASPETDDDVLVLKRRAPRVSETDDNHAPAVLAAFSKPATDAAPEKENTLVTETTTQSAAQAFDKLSEVRETTLQERKGPGLPAAGRNLEDLAREMLQPMLQAWLDEHLNGIVQERVDEEIARIARGRSKT